MSKWKPVMGGVPQGSVREPTLFSMFINDIYSAIECTLSKFASSVKLSGAVDSLKGKDVIQRDFDRLEEKSCVNLMMFHKVKCNVLHLHWGKQAGG